MPMPMPRIIRRTSEGIPISSDIKMSVCMTILNGLILSGLGVVHAATVRQASSEWALKSNIRGREPTVLPPILSKASFSPTMLWGMGSSAGQTEGSKDADGGGADTWSEFCKIPGKVAGGCKVGDLAADSYHRYMEDVELLSGLGVNLYKFSISWARLMPGGGSEVNEAGAAFYSNLIDALLKKGISPVVTLYQNDLPLEVGQEGGWLSPAIIYRFERYADACFRLFGSRVKVWSPINQPQAVAEAGYVNGMFPPSRCSNRSICAQGNASEEPYLVMHNILRAHARVAALYRNKYQGLSGGKVVMTLESPAYYPYRDTEEDRRAVERAYAWKLRWCWDPLFHGRYPQAMVDLLGDRLPRFSEEEADMVKGSADLFAINIYSGSYVEGGGGGGQFELDGQFATHLYDVNDQPIGPETGVFFRRVVPEAMYDLPIWINRTYPGMPILISEFGFSTVTGEESRGTKIEDLKRVNFFHDYLLYAAAAVRDGLQLYAISGWTLLDGAEFNFGYTLGFGIVYVDYAEATLPRFPKDSYYAWASFLSGGSFQQAVEPQLVVRLEKHASLNGEVVEDGLMKDNSI